MDFTSIALFGGFFACLRLGVGPTLVEVISDAELI